MVVRPSATRHRCRTCQVCISDEIAGNLNGLCWKHHVESNPPAHPICKNLTAYRIACTNLVARNNVFCDTCSDAIKGQLCRNMSSPGLRCGRSSHKIRDSQAMHGFCGDCLGKGLAGVTLPLCSDFFQSSCQVWRCSLESQVCVL